jgi:DNA polymerase-3 subunit alpha
MKHAEFVHLHLHTHYSLLDGAIRPDKLFKKAHEFKMPALAITDHGNMFGTIDFYQQAYQAGIKPIIGCEVYVAPGSRFDKEARNGAETSYHLILLAENQTGYKNLMYLVSKGFLEGFYYRPRIDKELLKTHNEGLIALSSCMHGEIGSHMLKNGMQKAVATAEEYSALFDDRRFYLELQENKIPEQRDLNMKLIELSKKLSLPLVATNDCHYLTKNDSRAHEVLLCLQTGKTLDSPDRMHFSTDEFYFKSPQEMAKSFSYAPESLKNTIEIAERCNLKITFDEIKFPTFHAPDGVDMKAYLEELARKGLDERLDLFPNKEELLQPYTDRLEEELKIIESTGFIDYFLIVSDFVRHAKEQGIAVGPGRGSAAGSLVAYALKITEVDPITYGLLFERFLNPERISLPDIDIDFCKERRDEIIEYVSTKYGKDNVAQIITFGKMQAKGVIRDVGRVMNMPYKEVDRIAKLVPNVLNISLTEALKQEPQLREMVNSDERVKELFSLSLSLEGLPRHASTHAAGIVISDKELVEYLPLYRGQNNEVVTQYAMNEVGKIGLIKFDFLGLKTLTLIEKCLDLINASQSEHLTMNTLPLDDPAVYDLLSAGQTDGVFQLESQGMKDLVVRLKPENMEDLIALLALYRPGPLGSGMVDDFIKRKRGDTRITYELKQLEGILADTYGVILYQEQVMQIASKLANFSLGDADLLRRAMGKKKTDVMQAQKEKFMKGAKTNKINPKKAEKIYTQMAKFAEYGFNKSHSTAYALIAFQTAYLKTHYPVQFMAALLTCEMDNNDKILRYMNECREMGIDVLPPDINESNRDFTVSQKKIRFGLAAVKNVGGAAIDSVITTRKEAEHFSSLFDFCEQIDLRKTNRKVIESLIKCGAFDSTGFHRSQMIEVLDKAIEQSQRIQKDRLSKQTNMFDLFGSGGGPAGKREDAFPPLPEWPQEELLAHEKESLGFYISEHPLNRFKDYLLQYTSADTLSTADQPRESEVKIAGIVNKRRETTTRKGDRMAFITLEDLKGVIEVIVFPELYKACSEMLKTDQPLLITGKVSKEEESDTPKILASSVIPLSDAPQNIPLATHLTLNLSAIDLHHLQELKRALLNNPGDCQTFLHLIGPSKSETILSLGREFNVNPTPQLMNELQDIFGNALSTADRNQRAG